MLALSIKQPWAWLILHGGKDIENREWKSKIRGRVLVHASNGMTRGDYESAFNFSYGRTGGVQLPPYDALQRGGIVGSVIITDCVVHSSSFWFVGKYGFVLREPRVMQFTPWSGRLGFFDVPVAALPVKSVEELR